jgi:hypothetical protein
LIGQANVGFLQRWLALRSVLCCQTFDISLRKKLILPFFDVGLKVNLFFSRNFSIVHAFSLSLSLSLTSFLHLPFFSLFIFLSSLTLFL